MQRTIKRKSRSAIYKCFCHSLLTVTQQILYVGNEGIPFTGEFWHGRFPHHVYLACAVCLEDCPLSHILFWALSEPWTWWSVLALDKKSLMPHLHPFSRMCKTQRVLKRKGFLQYVLQYPTRPVSSWRNSSGMTIPYFFFPHFMFCFR